MNVSEMLDMEETFKEPEPHKAGCIRMEIISGSLPPAKYEVFGVMGEHPKQKGGTIIQRLIKPFKELINAN